MVALFYGYCRTDLDCEMCDAPMEKQYGFRLHRHEYDPFEYAPPAEHWLCSEKCVRAWDNREPPEPSSEDSDAGDAAHRQEQARRLK